MTEQITILESPPAAEKMEAIRNPQPFAVPSAITRQDIMDMGVRYRGNKPYGGLWTSSLTLLDAYPCDWSRARATNALVRLAMRPMQHPRAYLLAVDRGARVLTIDSLAAAVEFTRQYHVGEVKFPDGMLAGPGLALTGLLTDWQRALADWDGITLPADVADAIAEARFVRGTDTAFATWNCESSLWSRWQFTRLGEVDV
jgi:hypothetical protein